MSALAIAATAAVGGSALSVAGSIMRGREEALGSTIEGYSLDNQARQYRVQERQLQAQEESTRIASVQAETKKREELTSSLETIQAMRAARGVGFASPTGTAILNAIVADQEADIRTERLGFMAKEEEARINASRSRAAADQAGLTASLARRRARTSVLASFIDAGGTFNFRSGSAAPWLHTKIWPAGSLLQPVRCLRAGGLGPRSASKPPSSG